MTEGTQRLARGAPQVTIARRRATTCPETCQGDGGVKRKAVLGTCPDPCSEDEFKALEKAAKASARDAAMAVCLKAHRDCICAGGTYTVLTKECATVERGPENTKFCEYRLQYRYTGACKDSP